jgi:hypothetical protein
MLGACWREVAVASCYPESHPLIVEIKADPAPLISVELTSAMRIRPE